MKIPHITIFVGLVLVLGVVGCATQAEQRADTSPYDARCEQMAEDYRAGRYQKVEFHDMMQYLETRLGKMTVADLERLLAKGCHKTG